MRTIPVSKAALQLLAAWKGGARRTAAEEQIFSTVSGKPIAPNNVLRRWVLDGAACVAADRIGSELFRVVQIPDGTTTPTH